MKALRILLILLLVPVLLVAFVATAPGTRLALKIVDSALAPLSVNHSEGGLGSELVLQSVTFENDTVSFKARDVKVDLGWGCLWQFMVCIESTSATKVTVNITEAKKPSAPSEPLTQVSPIPVRIENFFLGRININLNNSQQIKLSDVAGQLALHTGADVKKLLVDAVSVALPAAVTPPARSQSDWLETVRQWQYQPPVLPQQLSPVGVNLQNVGVASLTVTQGKEELLQLDDLHLALAASPKRVRIDRADVRWQNYTVVATGRVSVDAEHELSLVVEEIKNDNQKIDLEVKGNKEQTNLTMNAEGNYDAQVSGSLSPFKKQLPVNLEASWEDIAVNNEQATVKSSKGHARLIGDLKAFNLSAATDITVNQYPTIELSVSATGNKHRIELEPLAIDSEAGRVVTRAIVEVNRVLEWQGTTELKNVSLAVVEPSLSSDISGALTIAGNVNGDLVDVAIKDLDLSGQWMQQQLKLNGELRSRGLESLEVKDLVLSAGSNEITVDGALDADQQAKLEVAIAAPELSTILPQLKGKMEGTATISGGIQRPLIDLQVNASDLVAFDVAINRMALSGVVDISQEEESDVTLRVMQLNYPPATFSEITLGLQGTLAHHQLALVASGDKLATELSVEGQFTDPQWQGEITQGNIDIVNQHLVLQNAPLKVTANIANSRFHLSPHCWQADEAAVCVDKLEKQQDLAVDAQITDLPIQSLLNMALPETYHLQTDSRLNVNVTMSDNQDSVSSTELSAHFTEAEWRMRDNPLAVRLKTVEVKGQLLPDGLKVNALLSGPQIGSLTANLQSDLGNEQRAYTSQAEIDTFDLSAISAILPPEMELEGQINGSLMLSGYLNPSNASSTMPEISGRVSLTEGAFDMPDLPTSLTDMNYHIEFAEQQGNVAGDFLMGRGRGQVGGEVNWQHGLSARIEVKGDALELEDPAKYKLHLTPQLEIQFDEQGLGLVGKVNVPYARIDIKELPPSAHSPSADEVIVGETPVEQQPLLSHLELTVNVDENKANEVKVDALGLQANVHGSLRLRLRGDTIVADGRLNLLEGSYDAYGQELLIETGEINFNGPIDSPMLNIEAIRDPQYTADDVVAGVRVKGPSEAPMITLFSRPPMEQSETLSYLLRGKALDAQGTTSENNQFTNLLFGFGLSKSENTINTLAEGMGIKNFSVDTQGSGDDTMLALQGNIAPGLQLSYGVGVFSSVSEVKLRYQLMPDLFLEAVSGMNNALDLYYQFTLGDRNEE